MNRKEWPVCKKCGGTNIKAVGEDYIDVCGDCGMVQE